MGNVKGLETWHKMGFVVLAYEYINIVFGVMIKNVF